MTDTRTRTYGNWRRPTSPGIGRLGFGGSILVMGGLVIVVACTMVSTTLAVTAALFVALPVIPLLVRDRHGRHGLQRIAARLSWLWGASLGQHLYRAGPLGLVPGAKPCPPGLIAGLRLTEAVDSTGRPFALITSPSTEHHTVVLAGRADGASLVDAGQIDVWVAYWGWWLADLGHEPRLAGASVTVEAAPDTGERLRREVSANMAPQAPELALEVLDDIVRNYPVGSAEMATRITLTFSGAGRAGRSRATASEMADEIAVRLPGLTETLAMTGMGPVEPLTPPEVAAMVRVAYDPAAAATLDRFGIPETLSWEDAGPVATDERWDQYRHDSGVSVTWAMSDAPRGEVFSTVLTRMLLPHPDIVRKRVTLLYRPHTPVEAVRLVERDRKDALFATQQTRLSRARNSVQLQAADQSAQEEATGAGVVRFSLLLTATVLEEEHLPHAVAAVDNLAATARVVLRPAYGAQASAFAAALPLGLIPHAHAHISKTVRDAF